ncbi:molybdenum cofactor biosynthesis enzyme MoaA [Nicoletella semolina]|uniref:Molybdenum cofactor biosynthesis enzyme MoaA n=1 Tax=Nicoletella semolina TaxID=271160 RepID=A0A4R2N7T7_9PAST|nr:radical SAM protein [Nicoletella semolina]MDH2924642.1 hypothetical protein [Nicoletella semolina]TCP17007.1 molybdenum cofactor biosynthesis enzyme MoaA [Nicoletella semolina]
MSNIEYLFSKKTKSLLKIANLSTLELNDKGVEFIDCFLNGNYLDEDIESFISEIKGCGFEISRENIAYKDNSLEDISMSLIRKISVPIVHIIQNCNSPCIMCDCWMTKGKKYHKFDDLKLLFDKFIDIGVKRIMISGGEPLMHPELESIIDYLNNININIELNTNGILLDKNLWILKYNISDIVISLDGINREDYKFIRGRDKFDCVMNNINLIKKISNKQSVGARVTLTKKSIVNIIEFISFLQGKKIDFIGFSPLDTHSTSFSRVNLDKIRIQSLEDSLIPNREELLALKSRIDNNSSAEFMFINEQYNLDRISWHPEQFSMCLSYYLKENIDYLSSIESCNFPYTSFVVDYNVDLLNCFYSEKFGNMYDISNINWDSHIPLINLKKDKKCINCRGKVFCG